MDNKIKLELPSANDYESQGPEITIEEEGNKLKFNIANPNNSQCIDFTISKGSANVLLSAIMAMIKLRSEQ